MNDQGLLQEIEEDLQRQKFEALWKRIGPFVLGGAAAIVILTAAITGWQSYTLRGEQTRTAELLTLLEEDYPEESERLAALDTFAQDNGERSQALLARFHAADILLEEGNKDKAIAAYDAISEEMAIEKVYRQLATLLAVQTDMDSGDAAKLDAKLQPLLADDCPWRFLAGEYAGHIAVRAGDKDKAKAYFEKVVAMKGTPQSIGKRANDMLAWLNGGD